LNMSKKNFLHLLFIIMLLLGLLPVVHAASLKVTTNQDNAPGSLRAAITMANINDEDDTIYLPKGVYLLSGETNDDGNISGDLDIDTPGKITIIGDGIGKTIIDGNQADRIFHILKGSVSIHGVTIRNGGFTCVIFEREDGSKYVAQEHGGGIYNSGTLTLNNCKISKNSSKDGCFICYGGGGCAPCPGSHGGGIYNTGTLKLRNCTISENNSGNRTYTWLSHTKSGDGGGIYNTGTLYMTDCLVKDNITGFDGGDGGGIYNFETGTMIIERSTICGNKANDGGWERHVDIGTGGGNGGGIFNSGKANVYYSTITGNTTGKGGSGDWVAGFAGNGAGISNTGEFILENSAITANTTGDWNAGAGGGISSSGEMTITNCSISENTTGNGIDISGEHFSGSGGGIFVAYGKITLISCTVCDNRTGQENVENMSGHGGGIYVANDGTCRLKNTIVANNQVYPGNQGPDCWGTLSSQGYNLIENTVNCAINGELTGNITGVDPQLGPLAYNGGITKTYALKPGSPAVDAGAGLGLSIDQRGYVRPMDNPDIINVNDGADIGAYEYNAASLPQISLNPTLLNFGMETSNTPANSQTFFIDNSGEGTLEWTINPDRGWLNCTPVSGTGPGLVTVQVDSQGLSAGAYIGHITVEAPGAINSPQIVTVILRIYHTGSGSSPFGVFATPLDGITVSGSIAATGWVLDDIGVQSVRIFREDGNSPVYIGDAVFVEGARPDVEEAYPGYPFNYKAGWGYMMLTNFLPDGGNGTFTIHAVATDFEGNQVTLGTKTIICDNANRIKPFGAIDTPEQGGIASGSDFVNFGWALTPLPNTIPHDGLSITVWVDGVPLGNPVYNRYRKDIATLFPGYNNSEGAGGHFYLDTSQYENGVHTISWSVTDNAGNTDGIGSRYFRIQNPGGTVSGKAQSAGRTAYSVPARVPDISQIPIDYSEPVRIKRGYNREIESQVLYPDEDGVVNIRIRELEPVEIRLSEGMRGLAPLYTASESSTGFTFGFQIIGNRLAALPIGSFLDSKNGIFSWMPGPGFLRDYKFTFIEKSKTGEMKQRLITVRIGPQIE
jgi:hypothetical protein